MRTTILSLFLIGQFVLISSPVQIFASQEAELLKCQKSFRSSESNFLRESFCDSNGTLRILQFRFKDSKNLSQRWKLDKDEKLTSYESFDSGGIKTVHEEFVFDEKNNKYDAYQNNRKFASYRIQLFPRYLKEKTDSFFYKEDQLSFQENYEGVSIESFPSKIITFDQSGKQKYIYNLKYRKNNRGIVIVTAFNLYNSEGQNIGSYDEFEVIKIQDQAKERRKFVIIDTGFDLKHPLLQKKVAPDFQGLFHDPATNRSYSQQIQDSLILSPSRNPPYPFSHGTHVASIALKEVEEFEFVGFGGDFSDEQYLDKISNYLKSNNIQVVNMSFGFGESQNPFGASEAGRSALLKMMNQNPQTLFIVAAGNGATEITDDNDGDWPAAAPVRNKLVVAATNQSSFDPNEAISLATAFSNYGPSVEIAASGLNVQGANVGGTQVRVSGTSMAAPFVTNAILRLMENDPNLTAFEARNILIQTGYEPKNPLPIKNNKVLDLEEALIFQLRKK